MLLLNKRIAPAVQKACFRQMKAGFWVHSSAPYILKQCTLYSQEQRRKFLKTAPYILKYRTLYFRKQHLTF